MTTTSPKRLHIPGFKSTKLDQVPRRRNATGSTDVVGEFSERMKNHPHFRGRSQWVQARYRRGVLRLVGCLPNFYLKQLVQSIARSVPRVQRVSNHICVRDAGGISPPLGATRDVEQFPTKPR